MKLIFVVLIVVCTFVQSLPCDFENKPDLFLGDDEHLLFVSQFEYNLAQQYLRRSIAIVHSWTRCNETYAVPFNEAKEIFQNPPVGDRRNVTKEAKCLVDCTMRTLDVMTDEGLDEDEYMIHVKQLRYNYTSYDINEKSSDTRQKILETILKRATTLPDYEIKGHNVYGSIFYRSPEWLLTNADNYLIRSYKLAAHHCKKVKDPNGDACETSFMVMRCMMEDNRKRFFNSPFYPVLLKALD